MRRNDLDKNHLYEAVKALVETGSKNILLPQHKLFTLYSIAFQYLLFRSTKNPGCYIIRIEDAGFAEKLSKKAKDPITRKMTQQLMIPRKFKYEKSMFYLDFFHPRSWNLTGQIPAEKIMGAMIIKNSSSKPMYDEIEEQTEESGPLLANPHLYMDSLLAVSSKTIIVSEDHPEAQKDPILEIQFPFIKREEVKTVSGVTLGSNIDWGKLEDTE